MDSSDASQIIILLILLLLSAFFSSAETCLTTVNKVRMQSMAENNTKNAATVLKLIEKPTQLLSGILIGNNIVNLTASSLTTSYAIRISQRNGLPISASLLTGAATAILTILVLIFGEIVPKSLATINAEKLALIYAKPVYALTQILRPVSFLMNQISFGLLKLLRVDVSPRPAITENELLTMVNVSHEEGVIESEEREMITNVVDFGDSLAKDVMYRIWMWNLRTLSLHIRSSWNVTAKRNSHECPYIKKAVIISSALSISRTSSSTRDPMRILRFLMS